MKRVIAAIGALFALGGVASAVLGWMLRQGGRGAQGEGQRMISEGGLPAVMPGGAVGVYGAATEAVGVALLIAGGLSLLAAGLAGLELRRQGPGT